jgi:hypothetical protein
MELGDTGSAASMDPGLDGAQAHQAQLLQL